MLKQFGFALAFAAMPAAAQAQTQRACITPQENEAVIGNLLPAIMEQSASRCSTQIGRNAFLPQEGPGLADTLRPHADASWATAKVVLERIGGKRLPNNNAILNIGRTVIASGIANGLDEGACDTVSRLTRQLAPLPAENFAGVFALFLELGIAENDDVPFKVCRDID